MRHLFFVLFLLPFACLGCHANSIKTAHNNGDAAQAHLENVRSGLKSVNGYISKTLDDPALLPQSRADLNAAITQLTGLSKEIDQSEANVKAILDAADTLQANYTKLQHSWGVRLMHWVDTLFWVAIGLGILVLVLQAFGGGGIVSMVLGLIGHPLGFLLTAGIPHMVHGVIAVVLRLVRNVHTPATTATTAPVITSASVST